MSKQKLTLYYVECGDTLYTIARRFNTTEEEIKKNNRPWISRLTPGFKLWVPDNRIGTQISSAEDVQDYSRAPEEGAEPGVFFTIPEIVSVDISPRTIAYMGNSVPGYLTIKLETKNPTRGFIDVSGPAGNARIILSDTNYYKNYAIAWSPYDDRTKKPLPPGTYQLRLTLEVQNGPTNTGVRLGDITVLAEPNPRALIEKITINPSVISPKYESKDALVNISFGVSRPANVYPRIEKNSVSVFDFPKANLMEGTHSLTWNGRDNNGAILPDGEYDMCFRAYELTYNYPTQQPFKVFCGNTIRISGGEYGLPESVVKSIVPSVSVNSTVLSPNGDGVQDTVSGTITVTEKARVSLYAINEAGIHMSVLISNQELEPGIHPFIWGGKDIYGGTAPNGPYSFRIYVYRNGEGGYAYYKDVVVRVTDSTEIKPAAPIQNVQVIVDAAKIEAYPGGQGYIGTKGSIYPIIEYMPSAGPTYSYNVLLGEGSPGYVSVGDVEWIELEKLAHSFGKVVPTVASVRREPNTLSVVIQDLPQGTQLRILNKEGNWYRVALSSGKQGYIMATELQEISTFQEPSIPPAGVVHTVAAGDTLWKIAQKYGVTVNAIVNANNLNSNSYLMIGHKLTIPTKAPSAPVYPVLPTLYYVKSGDTLWKIAQAYGVAVNDIVIANKLTSANALYISQRLVIPKTYIVVSGDTLWKIAQKHNTSIQKLVQVNNIDVNKPLYIGQKILIGL